MEGEIIISSICSQTAQVLENFRKNNFLKHKDTFSQKRSKRAEYKVKVYHYCKAEDWPDIVNGSWMSGSKPGLGTGCRLCKSPDLEEFKLEAVFAFLEPLPESWMNNKYFGTLAWETNKMGNVLLEVEIDTSIDQAYVCDRACKEGYYYEDRTGLPDGYKFNFLIQAEKAYVKSKIPLREYMEKKDELNYLMPEVVILHDLPLERIKVSRFQPIIEAKFDKYKGAIPEHEFTYLRRIGALKEWLQDYKKRVNFEIVKSKSVLDLIDF